MKKGLENREEFLSYKDWFKRTYPNLPFMIHPNFVNEYNRAMEENGNNTVLCKPSSECAQGAAVASEGVEEANKCAGTCWFKQTGPNEQTCHCGYKVPIE